MNEKHFLEARWQAHLSLANRYGNPAPKEDKHRQGSGDKPSQRHSSMAGEVPGTLSIYSVLYHALQSHDIDPLTPEILHVLKRSAEKTRDLRCDQQGLFVPVGKAPNCSV